MHIYGRDRGQQAWRLYAILVQTKKNEEYQQCKLVIGLEATTTQDTTLDRTINLIIGFGTDNLSLLGQE